MKGVKRERWAQDFGEWFSELLFKAEIADYRYPVKGCGVWLPFGFKLRENILNILRGLLRETGHEEVLFPQLITSEMLEREAAHIASFQEQTFWVTHAGGHPLNERLALRPTSETAIAPMLKLWIRSHADLPKKLFQTVSIFRYETKATRPLIRVREVTTFKEAHTSHATPEEASEQVEEAVGIYRQFFDRLCLPYLISKRPDWDRFAGALYSIAFDTVFPDGRTLQIGTAHNLGQNFSKAFEVTFEAETGGQEHVYQTSYGISERVVAAVVAIHGDDRGLVLPPSIAPTQVRVIPIPYKGFEGKVEEKGEEARRALAKAFRVDVDKRDKVTPGSKFYDWEIKGIPLRVEIGPKDLERETFRLVRRDTHEASDTPQDQLEDKVAALLGEVEEGLRRRGGEWLRTHLATAESPKEAGKILDSRGGVVEVGWCGEAQCGLKLEEESGGKALGTPYDGRSILTLPTRCAACGGEGKATLRLSKPY